MVTMPTGNIDIAPTLLGLLGIEPPSTMKGRDLVHDSSARVVILATRPPLSQVGVRAGTWKLVHWAETGVNELFNVATDPGNTTMSRGRIRRWPRRSMRLISAGSRSRGI